MAYTTIDKPSEYFNTKLYTGNGSTQSITGVGFQPDLVWLKARDITYNHQLFDSVRGATIRLYSDLTNAESTNANSLTSFDSDGFSLGNIVGINESTRPYVSWNWLAGGTASSNTDGSITSSVSASTTSGFSIVSYTGNATAGATVGHGLGIQPAAIIIKNRDASDGWYYTDKNIGFGTHAMVLQDTNAAFANSTYFNNTAPSSSVVTLGSDGGTNANTNDFIMYCFAEIKGFSKFGSYTGNGSTDGTFVYTGFKPAFVLSKCTSLAAEDWNINDNKRPGYNVIQNALLPNSSSAEVTASYQAIDTLSNGFKWRGDNGRVNASGATYIYMAFASNPFVTSTGVPTTAR